ncbi:hypothetical protein B0T18DRAFT_417444 [Schizothecium vesticola]|uniref:Uncharacterized protein n=1 Tax=Schizothecium vesticola TaxID=314040 RepID=A0AA40EIZ8_9PEZI|nr:hypothetical protein B0T18DRAFT_417444 [Schizothecium vesticola]
MMRWTWVAFQIFAVMLFQGSIKPCVFVDAASILSWVLRHLAESSSRRDSEQIVEVSPSHVNTSIFIGEPPP